MIFPKYRGDLLEAAVVAERMHAGRDRDDDDPAQPARRAGPADRRDDGHGSLDGRRPVRDGDAGRCPFETLGREPFEGVLGDARRRLPVGRVRRAQGAGHLGPRHRQSSRAGATRGSSRSRAAGRSRTAACSASSSSASRARRAGGSASSTRRWSTRAGSARSSCSARPAWRIEEITHDRVIVVAGPGRARQAAVLARRRGRPADRARPGARRVRRRARGGPRPRAARPPTALARLGERHDLDALAAENLLAYLEDERDVAGGAADRPADRRRAVPRRARRLAAVPADARSAAGSTRRGRWRIEARLARAARRRGPDDLVRRRDRDPAARRRCSTAIDERALPGPGRDRGPGRRRGRRLGPVRRPLPRERRPRPAPAAPPARDAGPRSGSSASGPPTCSRWPAATAASRSSSRRTASACRDVFDLPALREVLAGVARREIARPPRSRPSARRRSRSSLLFDYVAAYMYEGDAPLAERRAQALTLDRDLLRELLGQEELRELLDPAALADLELALQALADERRATTVDQLHDLLRRVGDLTEAEVAARVAVAAAAARAWLGELAAGRRAVAVRIAGEPRWIAIEDVARYRDAVGVQPPPGVPDAFLGPTAAALDGLLARWARTHGPFLSPEPARRWGLPVGIVEDALGRLLAPGRSCAASSGPAAPSASGATRRSSASSAAARWPGCGARSSRSSRRRSARFLPAWQGVAAPARRRRSGGAALPRHGRARAARRGRRPARRRADPGLGPRARRPAGPGPRLPAAPARRARRARRGGLGRPRQPRPRRRPDRAVPARAARRSVRRAGPAALEARPPNGRPGRATRRSGRSSPRRGASFYREIHAAAGGGPDREVLDALWDLVWAGEVTNDTFAPLRALRWARPAREARRRPGRLTSLGPPEAAGRWSLVGAAGGGDGRWSRSPSRRGAGDRDRAAPRARARAARAPRRAHPRGGRRPRASPAASPAVYPVLRALEEAGRIRRGYFVDGLGAAQFALPGAVDRLRARARAPSERRSAPGPPPRRRRSGQPVRRRAGLAAPRRRRPPAVRSGRPAPTSCSSTASRRCTSSAAAGRSQTLPAADDPAVAGLALAGARERSSSTAASASSLVTRVDGQPVGRVALAAGAARGRLRRRATAASRSGPLRRTMPEGDTLHRTAVGLRPYLVGRTVTRARAGRPGPVPQVDGRRPARHRVEAARQEPPHPVRQRPRAADPPPDDTASGTATGRASAGAGRRPGPRSSSRSRARSRSASTLRSSSCFETRAEAVHPALGRARARTCSADGLDLRRRGHPPAPRPGAGRPRDRRGAARPAGAGRDRQRLQERGPVPRADRPVDAGRRPARRDARPARSRRARRLLLANADRRRGPERVTTGGARAAAGAAAVGLRPGRPAVPPLRDAHRPPARRAAELPRLTFWCPRCQGDARMTEVVVDCVPVGVRLDLRASRSARAARRPSTASRSRPADLARLDPAADRPDRPRPALVRVPARARAEGIDPARVRADGDRSLLSRTGSPRSGAESASPAPGGSTLARPARADILGPCASTSSPGPASRSGSTSCGRSASGSSGSGSPASAGARRGSTADGRLEPPP